MNSGGLSYESTLPAHAERTPAHGKALPETDGSPVASERVNRGSDWPPFVAVVAPIVAAYAAIAYGLYVVAQAVF